MFNDMWRYSLNLRGLYETPSYPEHAEQIDASRARSVIESVRSQKRELLTEAESKQVLAAYGIPVPQTLVAANEKEAVELAEEIGYPVVLKLHSETITHKSDIGGVQLNLSDGNAVRAAYTKIQQAAGYAFDGVTVQPMVRSRGYELILGSTLDSQLGPVILFGSGGELVEVIKDRALALPPLNTTLARRLMERTRIFRALPGVRGRKPVDLDALEQLIVRFSQLVIEQLWIKEIDINPLLASAEQIIALDARIILHPAHLAESDLPRPAIRPYPSQYSKTWTAKSGADVLIRPIRPEDEPMMISFHHTLSDESVYNRYFHMVQLGQRVAHERLTRACFIDYDREIALVAERKDEATGSRQIVAVGRLTKLRGTNDAEVAILVSDPYQNLGIGSELVRCLLDVARRERLTHLVATILPENRPMQRVFQNLGFQLRYSREDAVHAEFSL
jgi:acetyltransferase